jgi:methyl-accepting chemotaxis protein
LRCRLCKNSVRSSRTRSPRRAAAAQLGLIAIAPKAFTAWRLLSGFCVALTILGIGMTLKRSAELAFEARKIEARHLVEVAQATIAPFLAQAQSGAMTPADAKAKAIGTLKALHYDGKNYFFVYQRDGVTLLVPDKKLIGKNRIDVLDANHFPYVRAFVDATQDGRSGYVSYHFPKAGSTKAEPKISYVVGVPQWDWVIGTGVYVDDVLRTLVEEALKFAALFAPPLLGFLALAWSIRKGVADLIGRLAQSMDRLAHGDLDAAIAGTARSDEIGRMAQALVAFRAVALEKHALETSGAALRLQTDEERGRNEAERAAARQTIDIAVDALAKAMTKLSEGDLTFRLNEQFTPYLETLRIDFNTALEVLERTLCEIATAIGGLKAGSSEITQAADDLSRRTEQQAASLEQTAAALDEITATMRKSADSATQAADVTRRARAEAAASSQVVGQAVTAMQAIEGSSREIGQIIGVIDEIAFQTNLLAFNAGVEAARAGDAGRGFAVVASEVRALAQRSAEAAKEIKALISPPPARFARGWRWSAKRANRWMAFWPWWSRSAAWSPPSPPLLWSRRPAYSRSTPR